MVAPLNLRDLVWALTALLRVVLLFYIFRRRIYRLYPIFSSYLLVTLAQSVIAAWSARHWNVNSMQYFNVAWGVQAVVVCVRWLAVVEIARRILGGYAGIWRLANGLLFLAGITILAYSLAVPRHRWDMSVLNADRAVELSIAVFIVGMLVFARYYRLAMTNLERQLAVGFALFSCFWVVSNSIFQGIQNASATWWEFFQILAFFATLAIWIEAARRPLEVPQRSTSTMVLSPGQYVEFSRQLNVRLQKLDNRLSHLLGVKDPRS
jgi:hypothetical protein